MTSLRLLSFSNIGIRIRKCVVRFSSLYFIDK